MKYFITILLLLPIVNAELFITEIMYDPIGDDNNLEYVEIYSNDSISLSNFTIEDLSSSDQLKLVKSFNSSFSLIVEDGFNYSNINASIYTIGATIGNNLNNDRDMIILKNASGILDAINYDESLGGKNNLALCRVNSTLMECYPSPGYANNLTVISVNLTENYTYSQVYNKTKKLTLESSLKIEKIYNKEIKFGDSLDIRIKVYKGDTKKKELKLYVKGLSKTTKVLLSNRFTNYTLTLPLQLNPFCTNKSEGTYELTLEGLNQRVTEKIKVSDYNKDLCKTITIKEEKTVVKSLEKEKPSNITVSIKPSENLKYAKNAVVVYEASDVKARRYAIYFFCTILLLIIIYYIFAGKNERNKRKNNN